MKEFLSRLRPWLGKKIRLALLGITFKNSAFLFFRTKALRDLGNLFFAYYQINCIVKISVNIKQSIYNQILEVKGARL